VGPLGWKAEREGGGEEGREGGREGGLVGRKGSQCPEVGRADTEDFVSINPLALHDEGNVRECLAVDEAAEVGKEGGLGNLAGQKGRTELERPKVIQATEGGKEGRREGGREGGREGEGSRMRHQEQGLRW